MDPNQENNQHAPPPYPGAQVQRLPGKPVQVPNPNPGYYPPEPKPYSQVGTASENTSTYVPPDVVIDDTPNNSFGEKAIRQAFVRKVYFILMIQLAINTGFIALFVFCKPVKSFVQQSPELLIAAFVVYFVSFFMIACCESFRRVYPQNLITLIFFTLATSVMTGILSSFYPQDVVVMAFGTCAICCLAVTLFAMNTKYDFTSWVGVMFVILVAFVIVGLFAAIRRNSQLNLVYCGLGAVLFMVFLAIDTQLLIGGNRFEISPEEYIFAALQLYLDIINIFIYLLRLFGDR